MVQSSLFYVVLLTFLRAAEYALFLDLSESMAILGLL